MANQYKQIGNTAVWVASLLATAGGLLWWGRAPTAFPMLRPQDEAEIMTAVLERRAAIGRPMQFTTTYGANVSQVIVSNTYANLAFTSSIQSNGMNWAYGSNSVYSWGTDQVVSLGANDGYGDYFGSIGGLNALYYNSYGSQGVEAWTSDGSVTWYNTAWPGTLPQTMDPYDSNGNPLDPGIYGELTAAMTDGTSSEYTWVYPVYAYITNSAATVLTNTIGYYPNAAYQYANAIRTALANPGPYWTYFPPSWLLPSNTFMTTGNWNGEFGSWDGTTLDGSAYFEQSLGVSWWTNYVAYNHGQYTTPTNWSVTTTVFTNDTYRFKFFDKRKIEFITSFEISKILFNFYLHIMNY